MHLKLVCSGLVALARSRPTAFLEITPSGVRESAHYMQGDRSKPVDRCRAASLTMGNGLRLALRIFGVQAQSIAQNRS